MRKILKKFSRALTKTSSSRRKPKKHRLSMERLERREVLHGSGLDLDLTDSNPSQHSDPQDTLEAADAILEVALIATNLARQPISQIESGEHFQLEVFVHDIRKLVTGKDPQGVFSAYFDIFYDPLSASIDPDSKITPREGVTLIGGDIDPDLETIGVINDVGFYTGGARNNEEEWKHWFSIPMIAGEDGDYNFTIAHPDTHTGDVPGFNDVQLNSFGQIRLVENDIHFISTQLTVVESSPAADFEFRVVRNPTTVNSQGEVTTLPENGDYLTEFDNFYVEVYAKAPAGAVWTSGHATIEFNDDYFDALGVGDPSGLTFSSEILETRNTPNSVTIQFNPVLFTAGVDNYALVGRVLLGPDMRPGSGVENNPISDYIKPATSSIQMTHAGGTITYGTITYDEDNNIIYPDLNVVAGTIAEENVAFDLWAVMYDTDDSGSVGLSDLSRLVNIFGATVNSPATYQMDFNHDGQIGLSDLALLVNNFGLGRGDGTDLTFTSVFPSQFLIPGPAPLFAGLLEAEPIDVALDIPPATASVVATQPITNTSESAEIISTIILPVEINSSTGISSLNNSSSSNDTSSNSELLAQSYQVINIEAESLILDSLNAEVELLVAEDLEDTDAIDSILAEFENGQDTWVL